MNVTGGDIRFDRREIHGSGPKAPPPSSVRNTMFEAWRDALMTVAHRIRLAQRLSKHGFVSMTGLLPRLNR